MLRYAHYKYECSFILTILEVVVSIWWVAISIDMTEVTAKAPPTHTLLLPSFSSVQKSPLDKCPNEWGVSPEVGRLVEALFLEPETPLLSAN